MSDAARYRRVFVNEWHDPAFRALDDSSRVVRLYVSAGPQTTSVGCFRLSTAVAVEDLGGTAEEFEQRLHTVCDAFGWVWDASARVIWITDWFELNPPANPNVVASWAKLLRNVPDCDIKTEAIASINHHLKDLPASFREPWRELSKSFPVTESQTESRTESLQGSGIRDKRSGIREQAGRRSAALKKTRKGTKSALPEVDAQIVQIAKDVIRDGPRQPESYLVDALQSACSHRGIVATRSQALMALAASQQGMTS